MRTDRLGLTDEAISDRTHVVAVEGELDADTSDRLEHLVEDVIEHGATRVVVDLARVTYLDSAGLGVLLHCARRLRAPEHAMTVVARAHAQPIERIDITGTRDVLRVCGDRDEALALVEAEASDAGPHTELRLRLYVDTAGSHGRRTIADLDRLRATRLPAETTVEVIDPREHPDLAERDHVLATPALIRLAPEPPVRIIGDLGDHDQVVGALGLG